MVFFDQDLRLSKLSQLGDLYLVFTLEHSEEQKLNNREKSKTRARIEHVFGFMESSMNEMHLQYIGLKRINAAIGLINLTYNMFRKIQLQAL